MNDEKILPGDIITLSDTVQLVLSIPSSYQHIDRPPHGELRTPRLVTSDDTTLLTQRGTYSKKSIYFRRRIRCGRWCE